MNKRLIWFNGKIIPINKANINVLAPTSQYGANVFEGLRCYWNEDDKQLYGFKVQDHMKRLINSAKLFRFEMKYNLNDLIKYFIEVIKANNYKEDIAVRQTLFLNGTGNWSSTGPVDMFISPIPMGRYCNNDKKGLTCCVSSWERINDNSISPKIKVGANYINSRMAQLEALRNGYDSAIFLNNQGKVSEGPGSCIFIVRDGKLITPPTTASILESITRQTIIDISNNNLGINAIERDIDRTELYIADEMFLCGTSIEITPVLSIDKIFINNGAIGEVTKNITKQYYDIVRNKNNSHVEWVSPIY